MKAGSLTVLDKDEETPRRISVRESLRKTGTKKMAEKLRKSTARENEREEGGKMTPSLKVNLAVNYLTERTVGKIKRKMK